MFGVSCTRASQALLQASIQTSLMALFSEHSDLTWPHTAAQSTACPLLPPLELPPEFPPPDALVAPPFDAPPLAGASDPLLHESTRAKIHIAPIRGHTDDAARVA